MELAKTQTKVGWKTQVLLTAIVATVIFMIFGSQAHAAETEIIAQADIDNLKSLIIGLIAFIATIGTAYLTVLVGISAFSMIRRVVRG